MYLGKILTEKTVPLMLYKQARTINTFVILAPFCEINQTSMGRFPR